MNYKLYEKVLEHIPKNIDYSKIKINVNDKLIEEIINYTVGISTELCIVSLSGGVDSMVLTVLLKIV